MGFTVYGLFSIAHHQGFFVLWSVIWDVENVGFPRPKQRQQRSQVQTEVLYKWTYKRFTVQYLDVQNMRYIHCVGMFTF